DVVVDAAPLDVLHGELGLPRKGNGDLDPAGRCVKHGRIVAAPVEGIDLPMTRLVPDAVGGLAGLHRAPDPKALRVGNAPRRLATVADEQEAQVPGDGDTVDAPPRSYLADDGVLVEVEDDRL